MTPAVTARLRGTDGWPVATAVLTITDGSGEQVGRAKPESDGMVRAELPPGTYTVVLTAAGFTPAARTAVVTASGADLGTIVLERVGGIALPEAGEWSIDPVHSTIQVTARHLGISSVHGRFAEFSGRVTVAEPVELSTVWAEIEAASIDTGNKMRDDHLRSMDFLQVDDHPRISFASTGLSPAGGSKWLLDGILDLCGVRKPVQLDLEYLGSEQDPWGERRAGFAARTELRRDDFAINYNQVLRAGIAAVGTTLRVNLDIQLVQGTAG
ncbi:polyisoprenoid-binding protein YceI [Tamaricihabitans halophyticus]|uniref:Polyisoprenoid-binding protein YceI n=1 Tax=Tamaricihabitans halophyticus TaxID=1262583 RepID=A0A4R2QMN5_9PSEU|nr:YceI family protein [Tamaricihabitans halophyticus]TCP50822.1 polyisoprenoid-binding protein YceI [Tamaricihabitans halophyticus]